MSNKIVIIAAGGTGSRIQSNLPKQYLPLHGIPVLMHTINAFVGIADRILVVLNKQMLGVWKDLCKEHEFTIAHELVFGGNSRFQSVQNAIKHLENTKAHSIDESTVIAVHDAARPMVDRDLIEKSFTIAQDGISNVLATKSTNSIRIGNIEESHAVNRDTVWQIQTPQTFPASVLMEAYKQPELPSFTDDASVVEKLGYQIQLVESSESNLKITHASDFQTAQYYLNQR